ncbi:MAG TPA: hypothetical protein VJT67_15930, partial [Longimicrobiaceae bacterium]|nr:hypothetical protein [Longimicrobiaceae bacterium]
MIDRAEWGAAEADVGGTVMLVARLRAPAEAVPVRFTVHEYRAAGDGPGYVEVAATELEGTAAPGAPVVAVPWTVTANGPGIPVYRFVARAAEDAEGAAS